MSAQVYRCTGCDEVKERSKNACRTFDPSGLPLPWITCDGDKVVWEMCDKYKVIKLRSSK